METYTKNKAYGKVYAGAKLRAKTWKEDSYIYLDDNVIVDNEGMPFDISIAIENEWVEWVEPKKLTTITKNEALEALFNGKQVKALSWGSKSLKLKDGQIMLNDKPFNIMTSKEEDWVIVEACEAKDADNEIAELKAMVAKLLNQSKMPQADTTADNKTTYDDVKKGKARVPKDTTRAELLAEVYGSSTPRDIQADFKAKLENATSTRDIEKTVCEYIPYAWITKATVGSIASGYSEMRRVIKGIKNESHKELALMLFLPPQSVYEVAQNKVIENKKEEIRNQNTFDLQATKRAISRIKQAIVTDDIPVTGRQTKEREKAYHIYSYLTMVTARRQTEILKTLRIQKKNKEWTYCGIIKDREDNKCIKAYSLDDDFEFLSDITDYLQDFITNEINEKIESKIKLEEPKDVDNRRLELQNLYFSEREINSKFNGTFSSALKRITGMSNTASDWRDISAEMIYLNEAKDTDSHIDKRDLKAKILGHKYDGKLSATEHYDGWEAV